VSRIGVIYISAGVGPHEMSYEHIREYPSDGKKMDLIKEAEKLADHNSKRYRYGFTVYCFKGSLRKFFDIAALDRYAEILYRGGIYNDKEQ